MGHVDYDSTLIVGSFIAAGAICYIVISMEQLIFKQTYKKILCTRQISQNPYP
ncbi:hypothetical protein ACX6JG_003819, partial [Acinetobacter baumannii]